MNKKNLLTLLLGFSTLYAEQNITLQSININDSQSNEATCEVFNPEEGMNAAQSFTKSGIEVFSAQTNMSPLKVINMSPSVNFNSADAFGSNESSFHDPMRIRGKNQSGPGGSLLFEGMPLSGNPGGGKTIYDMENFSYIDLYKGYMPVDKSFGFSNLIGKVDLIVKRPSKKFGVNVSQMVGSNNTSRTYLRVDSGKMGDFSGFASMSYTQGDKWKGDGDLKRQNAMFGLVYKPNGNFKAEAFLTINKDAHNNYYQMSYTQAKNLGSNYNKDYRSDSSKGDYADYNKQEFTDISTMANIEYYFENDSIISFKPYYLKDKGHYWFTIKPSDATNTLVKKWEINHDLFGGALAYDYDFTDKIHMKVGYWMHWQEPAGPPKEQQVYNVASGSPVFVKYAILADTDRHELNSPFLEFSGQVKKFNYKVGARYLTMKLSKINTYNTTPLDGSINTNASISSKTYNEWLPSLLLSYDINRALNIYTSYTKSYGFDVNLYPSYVQKTSISSKATLQELWDKQELELSNNYEIGFVYKAKKTVINSNIYLTQVSGKQVSAYDAKYDTTYPTNSADAQSYGVEVSIMAPINKCFDYSLSGSYNKYYYTENFKTNATTSTSIKGNQIPDSPEYMANLAITYHNSGLKITPSTRYYSKRYGNADNTQSVPEYALVDIDASYKIKKLWHSKEATIRLTITNLFNKEYISSIITPDNALTASTNATTYQAGAPFAIYAGLALKF